MWFYSAIVDFKHHCCSGRSVDQAFVSIIGHLNDIESSSPCLLLLPYCGCSKTKEYH